jgi:hypothetical protein
VPFDSVPLNFASLLRRATGLVLRLLTVVPASVWVARVAADALTLKILWVRRRRTLLVAPASQHFFNELEEIPGLRL